MTKFSEWLRLKMDELEINQAQLSERSGITPAQISRIISGSRGVSKDSLVKIAVGLHLSGEEVYRAAGLLPPIAAQDERIRRLLHKLNNPALTDEDRELFEAELDTRIRLREGRANAAASRRKDSKKTSQT